MSIDFRKLQKEAKKIRRNGGYKTVKQPDKKVYTISQQEAVKKATKALKKGGLNGTAKSKKPYKFIIGDNLIVCTAINKNKALEKVKEWHKENPSPFKIKAVK